MTNYTAREISEDVLSYSVNRNNVMASHHSYLLGLYYIYSFVCGSKNAINNEFIS